MSPASPRSGVGGAVLLALAWTACLVLLAGLWIRSPFTGPGPMFLVWSAGAAPLTLWTGRTLRRWGIRHVPRSGLALGGLALLWIGVAWMARSTLPAIWAMDGLILRQGALRTAGLALQWLPGLFGLALSVAGLSAALEARYRLARGEVDAPGGN